MNGEQNKDGKNLTLSSSKLIEQTTKITESQSNIPKKQKIDNEVHLRLTSSNDNTERKLKIDTNESTSIHYHDTFPTEKNPSYCSFSTSNKKPNESSSQPLNPIQQILEQASTLTNDHETDEDEREKQIAAAKKLLFPTALATSFPEIADTLRNERRQEFCPIYQDEILEQKPLRQQKQKPVGSLLAKRIRWDDLKRKREEDEKKAQMQFRYGPYGPLNNNNQQSQPSFTNPYEQYYTAMQNQYEQMMHMSRVQQEHSGFWPEYQHRPSFQNNDRIVQNSMQSEIPPYTYPYSYSAMYSNNMNDMNRNAVQSYMSANQSSYYSNSMPPPPPPPPDEPYPY